MTSPGDPHFNPFPGLRPFQVEEEYLFFGREAQRQELVNLLQSHRFLAVLGASGSGKSSLVRAGLLPALYGGIMAGAGSHWNVTVLRPGGTPIRNLAEALHCLEVWPENQVPSVLELETALGRSGLGLVDVVRQARIPATENLLVVVDQFEELFRFSRDQSESSTRDEAGAFVRLLLEAARQQQHGLYVVLTMRSDFFGDCAQFEDLAEAINRGEYLVPRLTRDQKKQAIEGPIRVGGATIAPRLLQRLLTDVGDDPDQLPILQHALMRTWEHWRTDAAGPSEPVDLRHYEGIGGMREALSRHADEVFSQLPDDRHRVVGEKVFKALTERCGDGRGIRRPTRLAQLELITGATHSELRTVLAPFREPECAFLMPPAQASLEADTVIDISHESLMRVWQRLRTWVEQEAQSARIYRRLAETALLNAEDRAGLYHGPDLQVGLAWRETEAPTPAWGLRYHDAFDIALVFLDRSAEADRAAETAREAARQRELDQARHLAEAERARADEQVRHAVRLKWLIRGVGLVAMIALAAMVSAVMARKQAQANAEMARRNEELSRRNEKEAARQSALAAQRADENRNLAETLQTTLTRSDFINGSERIERDEVPLGLAYLARSLRTDPTYLPAAAQIAGTLVQRPFPLEPPVVMAQDKPIHRGFLNLTKDVLGTMDEEGHTWLWNLKTAARIAPLAEGRLVRNQAFTKDGRLLFAEIPEEGVIRGWDAHTGTIATPPIVPGYGFRSFVLGSGPGDSYRLVLLLADRTLQIWDPMAGKPLGDRLTTGGKETHHVLSRDGRLLAASFDDRKVAVWRLDTGAVVLPPTAHDLPVSELWFDPGGRFVGITSTGARTVLWWDLASGSAPPRRVEFSESMTLQLEFLAHSAHLIAAGIRQGNPGVAEIRTLDLESGRQLARIDEPRFSFISHAPPVDPDDNESGASSSLLLVGSEGRTLRIWDALSGERLHELPRFDRDIQRVALSPDGGRLATFVEGGGLRLWNVLSGQPLGDPAQLKQRVIRALFSPDGQRLVVVTTQGGIVFHTLDGWTGRPIAEVYKVPDPVLSGTMRLSERSRLAVLTTQKIVEQGSATNLVSGGVRTLRLESGSARPPAFRIPALLTSAQFSPDGTLIAAANWRGISSEDRSEVRIWDVVSHSLVRILDHPETIRALRFSPDGRRMATAGGTAGVARIWEVATGRLLNRLPQKGGLFSLAWSPDGRRILTVGRDGTCRLWDSQTAEPLGDPLRPAERVSAPVFSPDGSQFLLPSNGNGDWIYDTETVRPSFALSRGDPRPEKMSKAVFSADGAAVFTAGFSIKPMLWNPRTGLRLREMPLSLTSHTVALNPKGDVFATGSGGRDSEDGAVHLWDWKEGRLRLEPLTMRARVAAIRFSPDGSWIAAGSYCGVRVWETATGKVIADFPAPGGTVLLIPPEMEFSPDGRRLLFNRHPDCLELLALPGTNAVPPTWLPGLAEAVAANRLNSQGALEPTATNELARLRSSLPTSTTNDSFGDLSAWLFAADPRTRPAAPGAALTASEYALQLTLGDVPLTNRFRALQLDPDNGLLYARLGYQLACTSARTNATGAATNHWDAMARWYSDQATNLAPASAEAWALRSGTFLAARRPDLARAAAARALELDNRDPNAWYFKALTLARDGKGEDAYQAFLAALERLPVRGTAIEWENQKVKPYLAWVLKAYLTLPESNPLEWARLGLRLLYDVDSQDDVTDRRFWDARWLTRLATERLPTDAEIWRLRSRVLFRPEEEEESFAALKKAADLDNSGLPVGPHHDAWLRDRSWLMEIAGHYKEAREFVLRRGIPPRSSQARSGLVDLSRAYNLSLAEDPHRSRESSATDGAWWDLLPRGIASVAGVEFDLRGAIQLSGQRFLEHSQETLAAFATTLVTNLPVRARGHWIHFLHSTGWTPSAPTGTLVARYRLHYADGQTHDFPVVLGADLIEWRDNPFGRPTRARLGWLERTRGASAKTLYLSTWENPRPEVEIASLDIISELVPTPVCVFAVSVEEPKTSTELATWSPSALAEEARNKVAHPQGLAAAGIAYADKLSTLALNLAPTDFAVRLARAEVLVRASQSTAARSLLDALATEHPTDDRPIGLQAMLLAGAGRNDEAIARYRRAIELASPTEPAAAERRRDYVLRAGDLLKAANQPGEARELAVRSWIRPRDPKATPDQVDLGAFYNASLDEGWYRRPSMSSAGPFLRALPNGLLSCQHVDFDARGVIQLTDRNRDLVEHFPTEVLGIPVDRKADLVHVLHGTSVRGRYGSEVARYRLHYANGEQREWPIRMGHEVHDFWFDSDDPEPGNLVWRTPRESYDHGEAGLFIATFENPLPDQPIVKLDLVSALSETQPFVVAVTAECFLPDAELAVRPPLQLAERAFHRVNPILEPGPRTLADARRLARFASQAAPTNAAIWRLNAALLQRLGEHAPALESVEKALALQPRDTRACQLKAEILLKLRRFDQLPAARAEARRQELLDLLPARAPETPANLVDLTAQYNRALSEPLNPFLGAPWGDYESLSGLPTGCQRLGGIAFDLRGVVHLTGRELAKRWLPQDHPERVTDIRVGERARRLHFLHGTAFGDAPHGTLTARYRVHYADGQSQDIPIASGLDVRDWYLSSERRNAPDAAGSRLVQRLPSSTGAGRELGIYLKTWENPRSDVEITSIDFISEMNRPAPFLLAITIE